MLARYEQLDTNKKFKVNQNYQINIIKTSF